MKLRVGLVGLGDAWRQRHGPALRALADRIEVRAVGDQVGHRAEQAAIELGAVAVDGFRGLARREDIDAVLILAPQWYRALPILAACDAGKAVYCAAGLDLDAEEAERVKQRIERAQIAFMAEFPRRLAPATLRLKELVATRLGPPRLLFCHQRSPAPGEANRRDHRAPTAINAGELVELVDWCRYVVGREPTSVTGLMHHSGSSARDDDYQMMSLDFSEATRPGTGPMAQISCGSYIPEGWQEASTYRPLASLQIRCEQGIAFVDLPSTLIWFDEAGRHQESLESERPVGEQLLTQFHLTATGVCSSPCGVEDAYRALQVVQQARSSHTQGRRIVI